jgi:aryl-alcohol dehydrogenase-like predicted oxidoreductase
MFGGQKPGNHPGMSDTATLPRRTLGKTGLEVSVLGFGAAPVAFLKQDADQAADLVRSLLDAGMNLIDTATGYPGSHQWIGQHLSDRRDDYVLVSKAGNAGNPGSFTPDRISKDVDNALSAMKTDHIDVMLLHSCPLDILEADDALGALVEAREAGKIRHCGYSGDNEAAAFAARLPDVAVIETSVNVADQSNISAVLEPAAKHKVGIIAKRPIANAAWKDLAEQRGFYQKYAKVYTERLAAMNVDPGSFGLEWPELAMRFTLSQPAVATAIVGTTNREHAMANLEVAAKGPLDESVLSTLREAFERANDGSWTGQT